MEVFTIRNLNFAYPEQEKNAISNLSLSVRPGEFLVLCGPSGCGKSTLLRQLKTVLAPHGRRSGEILLYKENHRQCRWFQKALAMPRKNIRAKRGTSLESGR